MDGHQSCNNTEYKSCRRKWAVWQREDGDLRLQDAECRRDNGRRKMFKSKKCPSEIPKGLGVPYLWETKTLGILKDIRHKTHPETTRCLTKCLSGRVPHTSNWHVSHSHWGDSRGQFQPVYPCLDTSARAEWGIMGARSHVSIHKYCHASIHVASSQLGHVSPLSPLLGQPSRNPETSCPDHLRHWVARISLMASNLLWYERPWLVDTRLIDGILPVLMSTSIDRHIKS